VFILRTRVGKYKYFYTFHSCTDDNGLDKETKEPTFHVDVKSEELRDILREVLKDVYGVSLMEDKPSVSLLPGGHNMALTRT
jgi:hypothetical protein